MKMKAFDLEIFCRAQKEKFTVRPETERKLRYALLNAKKGETRSPIKSRGALAIGAALVIVLCFAVLTLTNRPMKDKTIYPLAQQEETAAILAPAPAETSLTAPVETFETGDPEETTGQVYELAGKVTEADFLWKLTATEHTMTYTVTLTNTEDTPGLIVWEPVPDPMADAHMAASSPQRHEEQNGCTSEGTFLLPGETVEESCEFYQWYLPVGEGGEIESYWGIRWELYRFEALVYREECLASGEKAYARQQQRMSAAISEGKIAVIGDHLVLPDSLLEEDPQRGALDYYIATGKIRKERTPSDRRVLTGKDQIPKLALDLKTARPLFVMEKNGYLARVMEVRNIHTAPYIVLDLQFDDQEQAKSREHDTFSLVSKGISSFRLLEDGFYCSTEGHFWTRETETGTEYHLWYLLFGVGEIPQEVLDTGLWLVPHDGDDIRCRLEEEIYLPNVWDED